MTNILLIIADDMRLDHLEYMPNVRKLIQEPGRTFTGARCNVALCQPNRIGLISGQLSRDHGDLSVGIDGSVYDGHDDALAAWTADAGYRCGLMGKSINFWDGVFTGGLDAPTGWSTWRQILEQRSSADYDVHRESDVITIRDQYQTEYLAEQAAPFLADTEPWCLFLTPEQPHAPFSPHPRDLHAWDRERCRVVRLQDTSTKPAWIRERLPLNTPDWALIQQQFRGRLRELTSVDRLVGEVIGQLDANGTLDDTVIMFTADNGVHQGEHRRAGDATKSGPYDPALRVPLVVRGPGFEPGPVIDVPVYPMQDITATIVDIAGATARGSAQAGTSLRDIARDPKAFSQRVLLHESGQGFIPTGDGVTTGPGHELGYLKLFRYPSVRERADGARDYELYDLEADPDELVNLAAQPEMRTTREALEQQLDQLLRS